MIAAIEPRVDLPQLTSIRAVAAWFVVLFHVRSGASELPAWLVATLSRGYLAVDLFFMLSGFVLWLNYSDRLRDRGGRAVPLFILRRIARIWPLHLVMLAAAAVLAVLLEVTGRADPLQYPWSELPLHIVLVQNWGFTDRLSWNDPAWSISCEFAAYLLFPLLVAAADWRRLPSFVLLILLLSLSLALHLRMTMADTASLGADIPRFGIARALTEFTMGTLVCTLWWRWRERRGAACRAWVLTVGLAFVGSLAGVPETLLVPILFAALLLAVALTPTISLNPLGWGWVHYLGEISYATYLSHFLLYVAFKFLFVGNPHDVPLPMLGLFLIVVLLASVFLHHGVERPAQRALNRRYDGWRPLSRLAAGQA